MARIHSFKPIAGNRPRILILGTMPGKRSLAAREYYAHRANLFWVFVYALFGQKPPESYREKKEFLKKKGIALWDVLKTCRRENSSADADIRSAVPNDIPAFLARHPSIRAVLFNGAKAQCIFERYFGGAGGLPLHRLPSTSPANQTLTRSARLSRWKILRKLLRGKK